MRSSTKRLFELTALGLTLSLASGVAAQATQPAAGPPSAPATPPLQPAEGALAPSGAADPAPAAEATGAAESESGASEQEGAATPDPGGEPPSASIATNPPTPPAARPKPKRRSNSLKITAGTPPARIDAGSEADLLGATDREDASARLDRWTFTLKGFVRAPINVGIGTGLRSGELELHSPPRSVERGGWQRTGLFSNPAVSLYVNASTPLVSANIIYNSNIVNDAGFPNLDSGGGLRQGYLTLKFPEVFGSRGGLALTVGAFSNRYGSAGRNQISSGYYGTYLFGRTHVAGEVLTANIDLTRSTELVLEHGFGAKSDVVPFFDAAIGGAPNGDFFQGQGPVPQGSNYLHHFHAGILHDGWLQVTSHFLTSWTPDDNAGSVGERTEESRLSVAGAEIHIDGEGTGGGALGHGFLGYSRVWASNLLPLSNALEVLHGSTGFSFKNAYFGDRDFGGARGVGRPDNDSGTVDTVLFQYLVRFAPYVETLPFGARDGSLAFYSMYNYADSPAPGGPSPLAQQNIKDHKLKFGAEFTLDLIKYMSFGFRADRVMPRLSDQETAFTALTPRLFFRSAWNTRELIILSYSRFFLGDRAFPASPYSDHPLADSNIVSVSAQMSF